MLSNELLSVGLLGTTGLTYGLIESDGLVGGLQAEDGLAIGLLGGGCPFGGLEDLVGGLVGGGPVDHLLGDDGLLGGVTSNHALLGNLIGDQGIVTGMI